MNERSICAPRAFVCPHIVEDEGDSGYARGSLIEAIVAEAQEATNLALGTCAL